MRFIPSIAIVAFSLSGCGSQDAAPQAEGASSKAAAKVTTEAPATPEVTPKATRETPGPFADPWATLTEEERKVMEHADEETLSILTVQGKEAAFAHLAEKEVETKKSAP
jgi:hypothetical protein